MNKVLKVLAIVVLALVVVGALLGGGYLIGRAVTSRRVAANPPAGGAYVPGMMQGWGDGQAPYNRPGMAERGGTGPGADGRGVLGGRMMDGFGRDLAANVEPLTIEQATQAVQTFLDKLGRENL